MARVKRGVTSHAKHKKVLKAAKGFYGRRDKPQIIFGLLCHAHGCP
ncbi:MAG: bL20 family ribosomal protein, partial [Beijerinckiaceae bacterium]|nr:bL20 family ribosomal protein [Beijerinckiaceae bacterium]